MVYVYSQSFHKPVAHIHLCTTGIIFYMCTAFWRRRLLEENKLALCDCNETVCTPCSLAEIWEKVWYYLYVGGKEQTAERFQLSGRGFYVPHECAHPGIGPLGSGFIPCHSHRVQPNRGWMSASRVVGGEQRLKRILCIPEFIFYRKQWVPRGMLDLTADYMNFSNTREWSMKKDGATPVEWRSRKDCMTVLHDWSLSGRKMADPGVMVLNFTFTDLAFARLRARKV